MVAAAMLIWLVEDVVDAKQGKVGLTCKGFRRLGKMAQRAGAKNYKVVSIKISKISTHSRVLSAA